MASPLFFVCLNSGHLQLVLNQTFQSCTVKMILPLKVALCLGFNLPEVSENNQTMRFFTSVTSHQINGLFTIGCIFFLFLFESVQPIFYLFLPVIYKSCL